MTEGADKNEHYKKRFENITYEGKRVIGRAFDRCTFYKSSLQRCVFEECTFDNCIFEACDLSLMSFKFSALTNVQIIGCKAIGIIWANANNPFSANFKDSRISFSSFYGKNLKKAQFINCIADDVDFTECNLVMSSFEGTELRGAKFSNTDLSKASFIGAKEVMINPVTNKLKQAKFNMQEALSFLSFLDIEIVD